MSANYFILACGVYAFSLVSAQVHAQESAPAPSPALSLVCPGDGVSRYSDTRETKIEDDHDFGRSATAKTDVTKEVTFKGTAYVEINGNTGRMKIPEQLNPMVTNSKEGWFDIQNLTVAEREITGKIRINMFRQPKLRIDRLSGVVTLATDSHSFTGQCERTENVKPKF